MENSKMVINHIHNGIFAELIKNKWNYLFLFPATIYTFVFGYATLPYMLIAFEKYNYANGIFSRWIGLTNFKYFFSSDRAWMVTRNTVLLNFFFLIFGTLTSLVLALLVNEVKNQWFARITQATMLFPYFISWVIVSYILYAILSTDKGFINRFLQGLGQLGVSWYSSPQYWRSILVISRVWKGAGYTMIIYLSAITGIDNTLYEAASIDGASRWQCIYKITLPLLAPIICILMLLDIGRMFYGDFGMVYALVKDSGQLLPAVDVIDTYVYRMLRVTGDPSMSMAIGLYQALVGFILVFSANAVVRKFFPEGTLF
jgi:putative aldouronate transport system permease protein